MARKHNYLNNKDLLHEIHKSKNTYCIYRNPQTDHDFDMILDHVDEIQGTSLVILPDPHPMSVSTKQAKIKNANGETVIVYECWVPNIQIAKEGKAKRTAKMHYDAAVKAGEKVKQAEFAIDPESYSDEDIINRQFFW